MNKVNAQVAVSMVLVLLRGVGAEATPTDARVLQQLAASCTTRETGLSGVRHACDSAVQVVRAPSGHVFAERTLAQRSYSGNGSEHNCIVEWADFVEVIPGSGITQPTALYVRAHARSPKGAARGRGWASCTYDVLISKYTR